MVKKNSKNQELDKVEFRASNSLIAFIPSWFEITYHKGMKVIK